MSTGVKRQDNTQGDHTNFVDHFIQVRRVTKVTKGGKRFSFSALVVTGNRDGQIGIAIGKSRVAG